MNVSSHHERRSDTIHNSRVLSTSPHHFLRVILCHLLLRISSPQTLNVKRNQILSSRTGASSLLGAQNVVRSSAVENWRTALRGPGDPSFQPEQGWVLERSLSDILDPNQKYSMDLSVRCQILCVRGGFVNPRHDNIRAETVTVCNDVETEPQLQPIHSKNKYSASANTRPHPSECPNLWVSSMFASPMPVHHQSKEHQNRHHSEKTWEWEEAK